MTLKGAVLPNHIPINRYQLDVLDPSGTSTTIGAFTVSGIEEELETVDLPDRTKAAGGTTKPVEFTITMPLHHSNDISYMQDWFAAAKSATALDYQRDTKLSYKAIDDAIKKEYEITKVFPTKFKLPDAELANEGEVAMVEWTLVGDDVTPIDPV